MHYLKLDESFLSGLSEDGIESLWVEIDDAGFVRRELGFDSSGNLVHRFPGGGRYGLYGIFDVARFETNGLKDDMDAVEFEKAWELSD